MIASAAGRSGLSKNFPDLKTILLWLGVLALPWIWLWTKWVNPSFSMVDDAADLMLFRHMREDFGNWLTTEGLHGEIGNGRLRPLYWLFRFVFYYLPFGENPASWQAVHYVLLALILTAVFVLMKRLTQSSVCAFTACALWTINPKTMENFCRFGPAECWQLLWFSLGMLIFYFLLQGKNESKPSKNTLYALLFTVLFCLYFTKETSVLLMPVSAVMALLSVTAKRNRRIFIVFFGMNVLLFALQRLLSPPLTGYSTAFSFSAKTIWDNLNRYPGRVQWGLVFLPATAFFLYRIIRDRLQNRKPFSLDPLTCWELLFLALGIIFFLILLPWAQPTPRYLVVTDFFFSLFMAVELRNAFLFINAKWPIDEKSSSPRLVRGAALAGIMLLAWFSQAELFWDMRYAFAQARQETPVQALELFAKNAKPNAKVLYLEVENEIVAAAAIYLHDCFGRPDIRLYSFSPYASELQKKGVNVIPLTQRDWPGVLQDMDYLYWPHRGTLRAWIDQFHAQLMVRLMPTPYRAALKKAYENLYLPLPHGLSEGTQIWEIDRTKLAPAVPGKILTGQTNN